jgi:hypothetical protein
MHSNAAVDFEDGLIANGRFGSWKCTDGLPPASDVVNVAQIYLILRAKD